MTWTRWGEIANRKPICVREIGFVSWIRLSRSASARSPYSHDKAGAGAYLQALNLSLLPLCVTTVCITTTMRYRLSPEFYQVTPLRINDMDLRES